MDTQNPGPGSMAFTTPGSARSCGGGSEEVDGEGGGLDAHAPETQTRSGRQSAPALHASPAVFPAGVSGCAPLSRPGPHATKKTVPATSSRRIHRSRP